MCLDVSSTPARRVAAQGVCNAAQGFGPRGGPPPPPLEGVLVAHERAHEGRQVVTIPAAFEVRAAGSDTATQNDGRVERGIVHVERGNQVRCPGAELHAGLAITDDDAPTFQILEHAHERSTMNTLPHTRRASVALRSRRGRSRSLGCVHRRLHPITSP